MPHQDWLFLQPLCKQPRILEALRAHLYGLEIMSSSILVPPYMLRLFDEDVQFFPDFFKLRFHIIPDINV
jgi:hypothetical protein